MQTHSHGTLSDQQEGQLREFLEWGAARGARLHRHTEVRWADDSGWGLYVRDANKNIPNDKAAAAVAESPSLNLCSSHRSETSESQLISDGEEVVRIPLSLVLDHRKASSSRIGRAVHEFIAARLPEEEDSHPRASHRHARSLSKACILAVVVDQRFGQRRCALCSRHTRKHQQADGESSCGSGTSGSSSSRHKEDCCWHPYFSMMPDNFNTALEWHPGELEHRQLDMLPGDEPLRNVVLSLQEDADVACVDCSRL